MSQRRGCASWAGKALASLISPLKPEAFVRDHLLANQPHFAKGRLNRVSWLTECPAFQNVESLVESADAVMLLAKGQRVSKSDAREAYRRGETLYFRDLEGLAGVAQPFLRELAIDMGMPAAVRIMEAFATGRAGGAASCHYDHEWNFQLQLQGKKEWHLWPNRHIEYPLQRFHAEEKLAEETRARRLPFPTLKSVKEGLRVQSGPGDVIFVPPGWWHETRVLEESLAVNFVLLPFRSAEALAHRLAARLLSRGEFRAPVFHFLRDGVTTNRSGETKQSTHERLVSAAHEELDRISAEDLALAPINPVYRWVPEVRTSFRGNGIGAISKLAGKRIAAEPRLAALLTRILPFRGSFSCEQLAGLAPELTYRQVLEFTRELEERGSLMRTE